MRPPLGTLILAAVVSGDHFLGLGSMKRLSGKGRAERKALARREEEKNWILLETLQKENAALLAERRELTRMSATKNALEKFVLAESQKCVDRKNEIEASLLAASLKNCNARTPR